MRTSNFDAILTSAPLNRQASIIRDSDGEGAWEPKISVRWWDIMPEPTPLPAGLPNLVGTKFGRLTVVGHLGKETKHGYRKWYVRCQCGGYETRTCKAILRSEPSRDGEPMCDKCMGLIRAQIVAKAARTGKWPDGRPARIVGLRTASGDLRLKDRP